VHHLGLYCILFRRFLISKINVPLQLTKSLGLPLALRYVVYFRSHGGMSIPLQRVTPLRRHALANAPAASYWLCRVLDDGGCQHWTSPSCKGCRLPGAESAVQRIALFMHVTYGRGSVILWWRCDTLCTSGLWMTSCLHITTRNWQHDEGPNSK